MPMEREAGAMVLLREAKRKSFLACLPQAWGQREGCRLDGIHRGHWWWTGANQTPQAQGRASTQHWVSLDPLLWPHLEGTAMEQAEVL